MHLSASVKFLAVVSITSYNLQLPLPLPTQHMTARSTAYHHHINVFYIEMKFTRYFCLSLLLVLPAFCAQATSAPETYRLANGQSIPLWPALTATKSGAEVIERSRTPKQHDRAWRHVTAPAIVSYLPTKSNGCSVLVIPGGGYKRIVFDREGTDLAPFLTSQGFTLFILKYRLPADNLSQRQWVSLQDAQRAVRIIRAHAGQWQLAAHCITVMGFSAGGHLAASVATQYDQPLYTHQDKSDDVSARPDYLALLYSITSMQVQYALHTSARTQLLVKHPNELTMRQHSPALLVNSQTPPTFIAAASDDKRVPVSNSIYFYQQLRRHHVDAELHIFRHSGHGFGIRRAKGNARQWPQLFVHWLQQTHSLHQHQTTSAPNGK